MKDDLTENIKKRFGTSVFTGGFDRSKNKGIVDPPKPAIVKSKEPKKVNKDNEHGESVFTGGFPRKKKGR